jgi:hypothetical protein
LIFRNRYLRRATVADRKMSEVERTKAERDAIPEPEQELVDAASGLVDEASELSFPASDPPSYMGGAAVAGGPPPPETPREPVNEDISRPARGAEKKPHDKEPKRIHPKRIHGD